MCVHNNNILCEDTIRFVPITVLLVERRAQWDLGKQRSIHDFIQITDDGETYTDRFQRISKDRENA